MPVSVLRMGGVVSVALAGWLLACAPVSAQWEQRNAVSYLRGPYNSALFWRHHWTYRNAAAIHYAHGLQHDVLERTPLRDAAAVDARTDERYLDFLLNHRAQTEPTMELYAPFTARTMWRLFRAIDWTHMHHEQTYDVLADAQIPWWQKKAWTDRAVDYYLTVNPVARSCAPLDVTMRRAATMMKPYFGRFRNQYPRSNNFFFSAHWWHPAIYEAQMLGGNGRAQDQIVQSTDQVFFDEVLRNRPQRMLLSREMMPRYSRLSPESANIFDNLHMLHGIAYDILAYEGWTLAEKRAEMYRVIDAMAYRPGDEALARKFKIDHPDVDPRQYVDWMRGLDGDMTRIMLEMHEEMMPLHMPEGHEMTAEMRDRLQEQLRMKLQPGHQQGEIDGSWHDVMMQLMPNMKMDPATTQPGQSSKKMVETMLRGWREKYGNLPDVAPMPMHVEPVAARSTSTPKNP